MRPIIRGVAADPVFFKLLRLFFILFPLVVLVQDGRIAGPWFEACDTRRAARGGFALPCGFKRRPTIEFALSSPLDAGTCSRFRLGVVMGHGQTLGRTTYVPEWPGKDGHQLLL